MSFINKLNFVPLTVSQEPQPEVTPQPQASEPQINIGIAKTADGFVTENPSDLHRMIEQQTAPQVYVHMLRPPDQTVDASGLFDYVADVQEPQSPTPPEPPESGLGKTLENFAEKKNEDTYESELTKESAKDTVERLMNAVAQSQKTQDDIQDAKDTTDELRKEP